MKRFEVTNFFGNTKVFTESTAPSWLTSKGTVPGSTMDSRWFWKDHVLTLEVGQSVDTNFNRITRLPDADKEQPT